MAVSVQQTENIPRHWNLILYIATAFGYHFSEEHWGTGQSPNAVG